MDTVDSSSSGTVCVRGDLRQSNHYHVGLHGCFKYQPAMMDSAETHACRLPHPVLARSVLRRGQGGVGNYLVAVERRNHRLGQPTLCCWKIALTPRVHLPWMSSGGNRVLADEMHGSGIGTQTE